MGNTQVEIRPPKSAVEIAAFGNICDKVGVPSSLASMGGENERGLMALTKEGVVIGGITYAVCPDGNPNEKIACIDALAVHPDYQRRGIGKNIISTLLELLRQDRVTEVTTIPIGFSKAFYLKFGFVPDYECDPIYMKLPM